MSMDRSLKSASSLVRHRNVLTRAERMDRLTEQDKFPAGRRILGLPKVANRKMEVGKAPKAEAAEGDGRRPGRQGGQGGQGGPGRQGCRRRQGRAGRQGGRRRQGCRWRQGCPGRQGRGRSEEEVRPATGRRET